MKILCSRSGIIFNCEHFPAYLHSQELAHPIFYLPQRKLLGMAKKHFARELTQVDSYLYFLALLDSTELVEWRAPCKPSQELFKIVELEMEDLVGIVGRINLITHPSEKIFTRVAISPETATLSNVKHWIQTWENNLDDFLDGYVTAGERNDILRREEALERLIRSPQHEIHFATQLAKWAELVGNFPERICNTEWGKMPQNEYWCLIIRKCHNADAIFQIEKESIEDLIAYCEVEIPHGSIFAHALMSTLRSGLQKKLGYLGECWTETADGKFAILEDDEVQAANIQLLVGSAPTKEPALCEYPTRFEYLKAKSKWLLAQQTQSTQQPKNREENM